MSIDPSDFVPIYYQLKHLLREEIKDGKWKPGDPFPSEQELQKRFGISRTPVRQALAELVHEGYLIRKKGKGSFVAAARVVQELPRLASFAEDMKEKGLKPDYRLLRVYRAPVPPDASLTVSVDAEEDVPVIERLMLAEDEPMAFHSSFLLVKKCRYMDEELARDMKAGISLYSFLERHGIHLNYAEQMMGAAVATKAQAEALNVEKGAPLLCMERLVFDLTGEEIEYVKGFYRADRYQYYTELRRG